MIAATIFRSVQGAIGRLKHILPSFCVARPLGNAERCGDIRDGLALVQYDDPGQGPADRFGTFPCFLGAAVVKEASVVQALRLPASKCN